ncbi:hypothetical protein V6N13_019687 [Hibiscus sabdariffa]
MESARDAGGEWTAFIDNLSRKRRYKFSTFAFVRFGSLGDLGMAISKLDNSKVDGLYIGVSKARFPVSSNRGNVKNQNGLSKEQMKDGGFKVGSGEAFKGNLAAGLDSRSFREVLMEKPKSLNLKESNLKMEGAVRQSGNNDRPSDIHIPRKETLWIDFSLVGMVKKLYDLEFVQNTLHNEGIRVKVAKQVSLIGVSIQCWHETFSESLGKRWGSYVGLENSTREKSKFSEATIIIRLASPFDIPSTCMVKSMGRFYVIKFGLDKNIVAPQTYENMIENENFADVWPDDDAIGKEYPKEDDGECPEYDPQLLRVDVSGNVHGRNVGTNEVVDNFNCNDVAVNIPSRGPAIGISNLNVVVESSEHKSLGIGPSKHGLLIKENGPIISGEDLYNFSPGQSAIGLES